MDQNDLFGDGLPPAPPQRPAKTARHDAGQEHAPARQRRAKLTTITPAPTVSEHQEIAQALHPLIHLGTSSWSYPGWTSLIWAQDYSESQLSRHGLTAYAQHPLMKTVSIDRSFYRPLTATEYANYAAQVPEHFRFIIKAPSSVTDAQLRDDQGHARLVNPLFLDPEVAWREFVEPAVHGLQQHLGALVFQLSPLPLSLLHRMDLFLDRLDQLFESLHHRLKSNQLTAPLMAVQIRDPELLHSATFVDILQRHRITYCLGLHPKLPSIEEQLPILRKLWPGPLVCRWNLHAKHGQYGYRKAAELYEPYNRLQDPDPETRAVLVKVALATARAGYPVYIGIANKAEGCAPLSVEALAKIMTSR